MISEKARAANIFLIVGVAVEILGLAAAKSALGMPIVILGAALFLWGCKNYAQAKGHSGVLGLLGLGSIIGLMVLVALPDKFQAARGRDSGGSGWGVGCLIAAVLLAYPGTIAFNAFKHGWDTAREKAANQPRVFVTQRKIPAYDVASPTKQIGFFTAGSSLEIVSEDPATQTASVNYHAPDGKLVTARCKTSDLK